MNTRSCLYTLLAMCLLALVAACNHRPTADYQLDYAVSLDTAGHYLNVHLTYEADSTLPHPADVVLTMPRWAPGYYEMLDFAYEGQRHQSLRQSSYDIWLNFMNPDDNARDVRISYYQKGPVIGLLLDIDIRRKTQQQKSLDDVMRLLYRRFYHELHRGFTEEEFWSACAEVAGHPLAEVRHLVETTDDIPYEDYLSDAGLRIDTTSWSILRMDNPTPTQREFLRAMSLKE